VDDPRTIFRTRWTEILSAVVNILYLCGWVAAQAGAAYFIQKVNIDEWLKWCFRIIFGLSTLAVVVIHTWEDVSCIWYRAKARVDRERKEVYYKENEENKDAVTEDTESE